MSGLIIEAEGRIGVIEQRLTELENVSSRPDQTINSTATEEALLAYQCQLLDRLKGIRSSILAEGGDVGQIKQERDDFAMENLKLKKEVDRLNYR
jgi:hypothetical protein